VANHYFTVCIQIVKSVKANSCPTAMLHPSKSPSRRCLTS